MKMDMLSPRRKGAKIELSVISSLETGFEALEMEIRKKNIQMFLVERLVFTYHSDKWQRPTGVKKKTHCCYRHPVNQNYLANFSSLIPTRLLPVNEMVNFGDPFLSVSDIYESIYLAVICPI